MVVSFSIGEAETGTYTNVGAKDPSSEDTFLFFPETTAPSAFNA